jgi:V8-like Glu-specific endopeptidase
MKGRFAFAIIAVACSLLAACEQQTPTAPRLAVGDKPSLITHGSVDGNGHPAVVLIVMDVAGVPTWRCSGTLIAPKVVVTAGHCTGEPGEFSAIRIFTESDVDNGDNNYPNDGPNSVQAKAWHSHPQFTEALFYLHDVGVIELKTAVNLSASAYGRLPSRNQLDALQPGRSTSFTAVGYGAQRINPAKETDNRIRMYSAPYLIQINTGYTGSYSLLLSNNAATGGTCFGDSGGPDYVGNSNVIGGVTSFGLNNSCGGTGGVFRLDRADVLSFVNQYLGR